MSSFFRDIFVFLSILLGKCLIYVLFSFRMDSEIQGPISDKENVLNENRPSRQTVDTDEHDARVDNDNFQLSSYANLSRTNSSRLEKTMKALFFI